MALLPRPFGNSAFDPFFGSGTFDTFENLSASLFYRAFSSFDQDVRAVANSRVDWVETPQAHVFKADLPGLKKDEIKIQVTDNGVLSISGERKKEKMEEKDSYRRTERSFGKFHRQFKLPPDAQTQAVSAKVDNGVLTVTVPKKEEATRKSEVRNIDVWEGIRTHPK